MCSATVGCAWAASTAGRAGAGGRGGAAVGRARVVCQADGTRPEGEALRSRWAEVHGLASMASLVSLDHVCGVPPPVFPPAQRGVARKIYYGLMSGMPL